MEMWHPNPDFFFLPGAGPVLDLGPYYVANLVNLIGPVKRVAALASKANKTRTITSEPRKGQTISVKTPTNIHALLEFHSGTTVTLSASWDVWSHRHGNMELYGTDGSLYVPDPNFFGGKVKRAAAARKFRRSMAGTIPSASPTRTIRRGRWQTTARPALPTWRKRSPRAAIPAARSTARCMAST